MVASTQNGTFGTEMAVSYLIGGIPHQVTFTGVVMDIDALSSNVEEKQNCYEGWVAFNRASGMRNSAYEHQIPEQLFSTETEQAEGVSTAKALGIAMANGQRIYTLTQANAAQLSNITIDDGSRAEIQSALSQGLEVTVHQSPITVNGWTGSGYSILDAEYGVGAYKVSGGVSGGFANWVVALVITLFGYALSPLITALFFGGVTVSAFLLAFVAAVNFGFWVNSMRNANTVDDFNRNNLAAVYGIAGGYALLRFGLGISVLPLIIFYEGILLALGAP